MFFKCGIYLLIYDTLLILEMFPKGVATANKPPSLAIQHSILACSNPLPIVTPFLYIYPFTLSFHLPSGFPLLLGSLISLTCTSFHKLFLHFASSQYNQTTSMYLFSPISTTPHFTPFAQVPSSYTSYTLSLISRSFPCYQLHMPLSDTHTHTHTLDCCALFHVQVSDPYIKVGRKLYFKPLITSMDTFLS